MKELETYYKRNLPHYQPLGESFFITFRLKGTLPIEVINKLKREKEKELEKVSGYDDNKIKGEKYLEFKRKYFKLYDDYLDNALFRPKWLYDERVAGIVKEAIHHRDEKEYDLIAYCIMPNHVHLVITPIVENLLEIVNKDKIVERFAESLIGKGEEIYEDERNSLSRPGIIYIITHLEIVIEVYISRT